MAPIQVTVFTGFLGAGKTSIILSLLPQLPKDYKVVLLKNEFGDVEVDSQLARQSSLTAVSEILNGCMCCVLIGRMKNALIEIREKYSPDRIIIETSGSAFPAPLVLQIRELARETDGAFAMDAVVTVVDCENFKGFEDTSPTAKMQAQFSDVILLNKWENAHALDRVLDEVGTLNDETPKIRTNGRAGVAPTLIFNLDSKLASSSLNDCDKCAHTHESQHEHDGVRISLTRSTLESVLKPLPKDSVYRVKGFIRLPDGIHILNWAFGRFDLTPALSTPGVLPDDSDVRLTIMGHPGEVKRYATRFANALGAQVW
ncbi:cobW-domain-containing protein [Exidia glandulosa HHB12029]|uniref:CobW-domain-containing protein n=1 Tax=Exidia glandulosa HHB12029 TaxID=1314781 RepID=A0A165PYY5_EXIGL|nr:cobW-domain-containing protein [Exidia glandulosa HHB12029]